MFQLLTGCFWKSRSSVNPSVSYVFTSTKLTIILGTSISLFIVTLPTCLVNTSIMMDGETPTIHSFHPAITTYNVQLYSSALLPFGNHSIHVDLLDFINDVDSTSCLVFDYAVINDNPDGASSLTSSTTSSPTCTPIDRQPS